MPNPAQSLPSWTSDAQIPMSAGICALYPASTAPYPLCIPSVCPPYTHRRFNFDLRCVSGEDTASIGRGSGGLVNPVEQDGYRVTYLPVHRDGLLKLADLENAVTADTAVVSLMWANNETGVLFPVKEIGDSCEGICV